MICAGNWKMHKSPTQARQFITQLKEALSETERQEVVVLVPALCLEAVQQTAGKQIKFGGQNSHWENSGAFTGENSPQTLAEMGAGFCLVGHSERRQLFHETDTMVAAKVRSLQKQNVIPIVCIGETLEERRQEKTVEVLRRQLERGLAEVNSDRKFWLAYEPVWAIGTGEVATVRQVEEAHQVIRDWLVRHVPGQGQTPILYGGSVKAANAGELAKVPNVAGFLIGGASLELDSFLGVLRSTAK